MHRLFASKLAGCCLAAVAVTGSPALAQLRVPASEFYGRGVHAYYSGQAARAEQLLTLAIASAPDDPRPYYFRGLNRLRSGRRVDAEQDMAAGAAVEARNLGTYAIGHALVRVQGGHRLVLERFRRQARQSYAARQERAQQRIYGQRVLSDTTRKWRPVSVPLEKLSGDPTVIDFPQQDVFHAPDWIGPRAEFSPTAVALPDQPPAGGASQPAALSSSDDPFADDAAATSQVETTPAAAENPFATEPAGSDAIDDPFAAQPQGDNPFGDL